MNSSFKAFCSITSIVTAILCLVVLSGVYSYVSMLPIVFFLFLHFIGLQNNIWHSRPLTSYIISGLLWMRMVFLPFYGALVGAFTTSSASVELSNHFIGAVSLCIYDCIAITIVLYLFAIRKDKTERSYMTRGLFGQSEVYFLFVGLALILFITVGRSMNLFDFFIKPIAEDIEREDELISGREMIIRQIVSSGVMFFFLFVSAWLKKRYDKTLSNKYFYWSLLCAILLIAIIVGERRTSQVYKAFASGYLLLSLYPRKRNKIVSYIGIAALVVLSAMTIYKQFYGFMYSSYSEAIHNASMAQGFSYGLMDAYFYGIDTVAKNLHYGQLINGGIGQFLYDFFRNIFGLNFFVPGGRLLTSQLYNDIIYSGDQLTGFLLSSSGYGYVFFGYALAPIITAFNLVMMLFLEKSLRRSRSIEWQYVFAYVFIRFGFGALGATPPLINFSTRFFVINALLICVARMFKIKSSR